MNYCINRAVSISSDPVDPLLSPVRNQNPYGTCWTFAAMACIEYQMRRDEGLDADLSENNLAATHGFDWGFGEGGNDLMSSAVFLRHADPVAEALDPSDGDIVIAAVDGEFTVKTLRKKGGRVALQPENENYPMIVMKGISELQFFSKVAAVIHRF